MNKNKHVQEIGISIGIQGGGGESGVKCPVVPSGGKVSTLFPPLFPIMVPMVPL